MATQQKKLSCIILGVWLVITVAAQEANAAKDETKFTVGLNAAQLAWHSVAGAAIEVTWLAFPVEASLRLSDRWGISAGIQYRYEDYWEGSGIWNDYHEVFIMAGPRFSIFRTGLSGWFISTQAGLGYAHDPSPYDCFSFVFQPEIGYSLFWGSPGIALTVGVGLLFNLSLYEDPSPSYTTIGILAHRVIPLFDVKLGFGI